MIGAFFPAFKAQYLYFSISTMYIYVNFMFSGREKYCSCHKNIKFISARHHVISSTYYIDIDEIPGFLLLLKNQENASIVSFVN